MYIVKPGNGGRRVEVDMTGVKDPVARAREMQQIGVHLVLYHRSIDEENTQGTQWDDKARQTVQQLCGLDLDVAVAGGINLGMLKQLPRSPLYSMMMVEELLLNRIRRNLLRQLALGSKKFGEVN